MCACTDTRSGVVFLIVWLLVCGSRKRPSRKPSAGAGASAGDESSAATTLVRDECAACLSFVHG